MPTDLNPVRPGDLITSDFMNRLLDHLDTLEQRIQDLEDDASTGQQVRITGFFPEDEQEVGRILTIEGRNFLIPPSLNQVTIEDIPVVEYDESTPTLLRVRVPSIPGVPTEVTVRVENSNGADEDEYFIAPESNVGDDPPEITEVENVETGGNILQVGGDILIRGVNFASDPTENTLSIASRLPGREDEVYDITDIAVADSSETEIFATLPSDIVIHSSFTSDPMEIRLVVGDYDTERFSVQVND